MVGCCWGTCEPGSGRFATATCATATPLQVSKSASAAFDDVVKVDTVIDQKTLAELVTSQCPVSFSYATYDHLVHLYAHSDDSDLEPGHIEVMNQLGHCNLVTLDLKFNTFFGPPPIPAAAWQKLQGGWPNLKVARFDGQLVAKCFFFSSI